MTFISPNDSEEHGDVIANSMPSCAGLARRPSPWMGPGDVVEVEIEKIGVLRNPIALAA